MTRLLFIACVLVLVAKPAEAASRHFWHVASPNHEQTFAYGMEQDRLWMQWGRDRHLVLKLKYTNDPFVDRWNPRVSEMFFFPFPGITLGKDGHTFYYRTPSGRLIPVASKRADFFGIDEVKLLSNAFVVVETPHGYISVRLDIVNPASL